MIWHMFIIKILDAIAINHHGNQGMLWQQINHNKKSFFIYFFHPFPIFMKQLIN